MFTQIIGGEMEEIISMVGNYGFPIAVSFYLLLRLESKMDKLTESIAKLTLTLSKGDIYANSNS